MGFLKTVPPDSVTSSITEILNTQNINFQLRLHSLFPQCFILMGTGQIAGLQSICFLKQFKYNSCTF